MIPLSAHRVVYVATGERHIREAAGSLASLWRHNEGTAVTVYIDRASRRHLGTLGLPIPARAELLELLDLPDPTYSWSDKPLALSRIRQGRVLFLDTDTRICGRISNVLDLLDSFDLAAAHAPIRLDPRQPGELARRVPETFPELNTGVLAFRCTPAVEEFLERWRLLHAEVLRSVGHGTVGDQAAFRVALYESRLRFSVLTPEYNCRFVFPTYVYGPVRILHGRSPDLARIERQVNRFSEPRVIVPGLGVLRTSPPLAWVRRKRDSWREQGARQIIRNRVERLRARRR